MHGNCPKFVVRLEVPYHHDHQHHADECLSTPNYDLSLISHHHHNHNILLLVIMMLLVADAGGSLLFSYYAGWLFGGVYFQKQTSKRLWIVLIIYPTLLITINRCPQCISPLLRCTWWDVVASSLTGQYIVIHQQLSHHLTPSPHPHC